MKSFLDKCDFKPTFYHDLIKYYSDEEILNLKISNDLIVVQPICLKRNNLSNFKNVFIKVYGDVRLETVSSNDIYLYFSNKNCFNTDFYTLRFAKCNIFELKMFYQIIEKYPSLTDDLIRIKVLFHGYEFSEIRWNDIMNHRISFLKIKGQVSDCDYLVKNKISKYKLMLMYFTTHYPNLSAILSTVFSMLISLFILKPLLDIFFPG